MLQTLKKNQNLKNCSMELILKLWPYGKFSSKTILKFVKSKYDNHFPIEMVKNIRVKLKIFNY